MPFFKSTSLVFHAAREPAVILICQGEINDIWLKSNSNASGFLFVALTVHGQLATATHSTLSSCYPTQQRPHLMERQIQVYITCRHLEMCVPQPEPAWRQGPPLLQPEWESVKWAGMWLHIQTTTRVYLCSRSGWNAFGDAGTKIDDTGIKWVALWWLPCTQAVGLITLHVSINCGSASSIYSIKTIQMNVNNNPIINYSGRDPSDA